MFRGCKSLENPGIKNHTWKHSIYRKIHEKLHCDFKQALSENSPTTHSPYEKKNNHPFKNTQHNTHSSPDPKRPVRPKKKRIRKTPGRRAKIRAQINYAINLCNGVQCSVANEARNAIYHLTRQPGPDQRSPFVPLPWLWYVQMSGRCGYWPNGAAALKLLMPGSFLSDFGVGFRPVLNREMVCFVVVSDLSGCLCELCDVIKSNWLY